MNTHSPVFTVFTPTYNRVHTLQRVYDGLKNQTFRNFEWLIIDDGSTDRTNEIVEDWQHDALFAIRYYWQENRGKHMAHNLALKKAQGDFFLVLDSDDSVLPNALERLHSLWESIPEDQKVDFCGTAALCQDQHGNVVGQRLPLPVMDVSLLEMRFIHKRSQEFFTCYKTSIVKKHPFPEIENARFIPEGLVWSQIGQRYKTRYSNEALQIYYVEPDVHNLMNQDPALLGGSHSLWHQFTLNQEISWFRYQPIYFLKSAVHYARFSLHNQKGFWTQFKALNNWLARVLWLSAIAPGWMFYVRDRMSSFRGKQYD